MQVDKNRLVNEALAQLSRLGQGEGVLLQPFKKDRHVCVIEEHGSYRVVERGFSRKDFVVERGKIRKLLKTLCRKEFPRSHKVWLTRCTAEEVQGLRGRWSVGEQ